MELDDILYEKIINLTELGEEFFENDNFNEAIEKYKDALSLIPEPKFDWEASTWIYTALGDTYFFMGKYDDGLNYLFEAQKCPDGMANPFILLRIGECFFELKNENKAKDYLLKAYMVEGKKIFDTEDKKYFESIKDLIKINKNNKIKPKKILNKKIKKAKYVGGEIGFEIEKVLWPEDLIPVEEERPKITIDLYEKTWDKIPGESIEEKCEYSESYLLVKRILDKALEDKDFNTMKKWVNIFFKADLKRPDGGEREMYAGKVAFELGNKEKAKEYFTTAFQKSNGRKMMKNDKYTKFFFEEC